MNAACLNGVGQKLHSGMKWCYQYDIIDDKKYRNWISTANPGALLFNFVFFCSKFIKSKFIPIESSCLELWKSHLDHATSKSEYAKVNREVKTVKQQFRLNTRNPHNYNSCFKLSLGAIKRKTKNDLKSTTVRVASKLQELTRIITLQDQQYIWLQWSQNMRLKISVSQRSVASKAIEEVLQIMNVTWRNS